MKVVCIQVKSAEIGHVQVEAQLSLTIASGNAGHSRENASRAQRSKREACSPRRRRSLATFAAAMSGMELLYRGARTRMQGDGVFAARRVRGSFAAKDDSARGGGGSATSCSVLPE